MAFVKQREDMIAKSGGERPHDGRIWKTEVESVVEPLYLQNEPSHDFVWLYLMESTKSDDYY